METKTPWWKFALAIASFILIFFLGPTLIYLFLQLSNLFVPRAYQNTNEWIYVLSCVTGMVLACGSLEKILKRTQFAFCMIICIIGAIYSVAVAVWNFAIRATEFYQFIGLAAEGIVATVFAVLYGGNIKNNRRGEGGE